MNARTDILQAAAAGLLGDPPPGSDHVDADFMVAYLEGTLSNDDVARVREHLLGCAECNGLLLDYERLRSGELGAELDASEAEVAAVWRAVARDIDKEKPPAEVVAFPAPALKRPSTGYMLALAACLTAVVGLGGWVHNLRQALLTPQLNVPVYDLRTTTPRAGEEAVPLVLEQGHRSYVLVLNPPWDPDQAVFALSVVRAGGEVVWRGEGLRRNAYGNVSVALPRDLLVPGEYRLLLEAIPAGGSSSVHEFVLRIEHAAGKARSA